MQSKLVRIVALTVMLAAAAALGLPNAAAAAERVKVGTLRCNLAPTVGFLVVSRQRLSCTYTPDGPWPPETISVISPPSVPRSGSPAAAV